MEDERKKIQAVARDVAKAIRIIEQETQKSVATFEFNEKKGRFFLRFEEPSPILTPATD
jgi:hypothetical protein